MSPRIIPLHGSRPATTSRREPTLVERLQGIRDTARAFATEYADRQTAEDFASLATLADNAIRSIRDGASAQ